MCVETLKREFQVKHLGFKEVKKQHFFWPQFRWPPFIYIIWRWLVAGSLTTTLVYTLYTESRSPASGAGDKTHPSVVFMTIWSLIIVTCYSLVFALVAALHNIEACHLCVHRRDSMAAQVLQRQEEEEDDRAGLAADDVSLSSFRLDDDDTEFHIPIALPFYMKILWILYAVALPSSILVAGVYFGFLFPSYIHVLRPMDFCDHGLPVIVMVLDTLVFSAIPVRLLHYVYPTIFGAAYTIFSAIYWSTDHSNVIYPVILDWNKPGPSSGCVLGLAFVGLPLLQFLSWVLYRIKMCLYRRCRRAEGEGAARL